MDLPPPPCGPHARVGIDLVEVGRLTALLERYPALAGRLFTDSERTQCAGDHGALAARWAAREAAAKILGGLARFDLRDVAVERPAGAAPRLVLGGRALTLARQQGLGRWEVSLTHDGGYAAAVVLAWGATVPSGPEPPPG